VPLRQLRRVRWAVRAVLTLGVAASVAANILHAHQNPIAQAIAAWPPLALLLTVELISRVPVHRRSLAAVRLGATAAIAGIAAWVSYWHMAGVAARYGETGAAPYLLPLSVDGLVVVASVSLVELAGRLRAVEEKSTMRRATEDPVDGSPVPPASAPAEAPASGGTSELVEAKPLAEALPVPANTLLGDTLRERLGEHFGERLAQTRPRQRATPAAATGRATASARVPAPVPAQRRGRPVEETRRLAAELAARQPEATTDDLAKQLGISTQRLKRVLSA
jgi:hypothetical protein